MTISVEAFFGRGSQKVVGETLQETLYDLSALARIVKQAHWNVIGPSFRDVHVRLDDLYADVEFEIDAVAERLAAIGMPPSGQCSETAAGAKLQQLPLGFLRDSSVIELLSDRVGSVYKTINARRRVAEEFDFVTADLYQALLHKLDRHLWRLRSRSG
jgi:starvation-inducible DNA-binding protein